MLCSAVLLYYIVFHRSDDDCENAESEEVLEEHITRLLSREYIDLLFAIFINRRDNSVVANSDGTEDMMVEDENAAPQQRDDSLNQLGQLVVKTEVSFQLYLSKDFCV